MLTAIVSCTWQQFFQIFRIVQRAKVKMCVMIFWNNSIGLTDGASEVITVNKPARNSLSIVQLLLSKLKLFHIIFYDFISLKKWSHDFL
jgi:hypothetical protein